CAGQAELLAQAALRRPFHGLAAARMTAAAVRPVHGPKSLAARALLDQKLAACVEDQEREGPMQHATALVAELLAELAQFVVRLVHHDQRLVAAARRRACFSIVKFIHGPDHSRCSNGACELAPKRLLQALA